MKLIKNYLKITGKILNLLLVLFTATYLFGVLGFIRAFRTGEDGSKYFKPFAWNAFNLILTIIIIAIIIK